MFFNQLYKLAGLIGLAVTPAAAFAEVKADHCGSILSSDGRHKASFTLARNADPDARMIRVFLCDRSSNCDTVFEAPSGSKVSMQWRSNGDLAVSSNRGSLVPRGTVDSIAEGRPPVRVLRDADVPGASSGSKLDFAASRCRVEAPIASQTAATSARS